MDSTKPIVAQPIVTAHPTLLVLALLLVDGLHFVFARALHDVLPPLTSVVLVLGMAFALPWAIVCAVAAAHYVVVLFDSAALTAGVVAAAEEGRRGATLALHSVSGFAAGSVAPVVLGAVLQSSGGAGHGAAWLAAFGSLSVVSLGGYLVLGRWSERG